jgi:NADH dehydrogenase
LEVPGLAGVWAVGDCAAIIDSTSKLPYPPSAQRAIREGRCAGKNIDPRLRAKPVEPFRFKMVGQLATIGRCTGVARIFGLKFSRSAGWLLRRTV